MSEITIEGIETAVLNRLKQKWAGVSEFDVGKDFESILKTPAVSVVVERIGFRRVIRSYELEPVITIYTVFKSLRPAERRAGVYPMVMGVIGLLVGRTLDLDIEPFEPAGPIVEVFHGTLKQNGLVAFKIEIKTTFDIDEFDEEEMIRLINTANTFVTSTGETIISESVEFETSDNGDEEES